MPTLGESEHLAASVAALRREGGRVVVIAPRDVSSRLVSAASDSERDWTDDVQWVETDDALGFAAANVAGLRAAPEADYVALVNDDAVVEPGWAEALLGELERHPGAAAAQGLVLQGVLQEVPGTVLQEVPGTERAGTDQAGETDPEDALVDGAGLAWNGWWQAVQAGHGRVLETSTEPREIFGVSATAALYRRAALDEVAPLFDVRLGSYYEDVDLAVRLRAAGWTARRVPSARARHAGSTTGRRRGAAYLVRRNRYAVLARALGAGVLPRLPTMGVRDALDAVRRLADGDLAGAWTVLRGAAAGLLRLPSAWRTRPGLRRRLAARELRRWRDDESSP